MLTCQRLVLMSLAAAVCCWFSPAPASAAEAPQEPLPLNFFKHLQAGTPQTVVVYGTSLSHTAEWPRALDRYFRQEFPGLVFFTNVASSGKQSQWGLANIKRRVLSNRPDLVFIEFSMNDSATKHDISVSQAIGNLDQMVRLLQTQNPDVEIVLQTMNPAWDTPRNPGRTAASDRPHLLEYYDSYRQYARMHHLPLADHYENWLALRNRDVKQFQEWLPDGTHPTPDASLSVTWPAIKSLLERSRSAVGADQRRLPPRQFPAGPAPAPLSVRDFGALGDGKTLDTAAIQKALDAAARGGEREVRVPAGSYVTGSLVLQSHTTLHLEAGASLLGSTNRHDYPLIQARWEGIETNCHRALISAEHAEDIAITGAGTIEGSPAVGRLRNPRGPCVVELLACDNVRVEGVTLKSTRMWTLHPAYCHDVRIAGVIFETSGANSDGIDPDSCQRVLIEGCTFTTGDDNIAIKSGKGQEGVRLGRPSEDITITNCTFIKGYTSIAFGSELSGGIRRVRISNCTFKQGRAALQLKSREGRAGFLEDITAEHLVVGPEPLLEITTQYRYNPDPQGVPGPAGLTRFRNLRIRDVQIAATKLLSIEGTAAKPVDGVQISQISGTCQKASDIQNATNVLLSDIHIEGISGPLYLTNNVAGSGFGGAAPLSERSSKANKN